MARVVNILVVLFLSLIAQAHFCAALFMRPSIKNNGFATPEETCVGGKVFKGCGTACPQICGEPKPMICTANCVSECQCPLEHPVWDPTQEICVASYDDCGEPSEPLPPTCTGGKVFKGCGTACPQTCGEPEFRPCTMNCVSECQCPSELPIWDPTQEACITSYDLCSDPEPEPKPEPTLEEPVCSGGKVFKECGTACPNICFEEVATFCTEQCVSECQCPSELPLWDPIQNNCVANKENCKRPEE